MTTDFRRCPVCGLRGCAAKWDNTEIVSPLLVRQLATALELDMNPLVKLEFERHVDRVEARVAV